MTTSGKNRIMIYGPKPDGNYVVEFMTTEGDVLAISMRYHARKEAPLGNQGWGATDHACGPPRRAEEWVRRGANPG